MANATLPGLGFHHIAIRCSSLERSLKFYCEGLGCKVMYRWGEGDKTICMVDLGDGTVLELFAGGTEGEAVDEHRAGAYFHLALRVNDVRAAYDRALAFGATPRSEPNLVHLSAEPRSIVIDGAFVYGPDQEILEFFRLAE